MPGRREEQGTFDVLGISEITCRDSCFVSRLSRTIKSERHCRTLSLIRDYVRMSIYKRPCLSHPRFRVSTEQTGTNLNTMASRQYLSLQNILGPLRCAASVLDCAPPLGYRVQTVPPRDIGGQEESTTGQACVFPAKRKSCEIIVNLTVLPCFHLECLDLNVERIPMHRMTPRLCSRRREHHPLVSTQSPPLPDCDVSILSTFQLRPSVISLRLIPSPMRKLSPASMFWIA